jgi:PAS domain S-box-containing protein
MTALTILLLQALIYVAFPFYFTTLPYHLRSIAFYIYLSVLYVLGGFLGAVYTLPITESIRISGGNLNYGAFMMTIILLVIIESDLDIVRHVLRLVIGVNVFKLLIYYSLSLALANDLIINPYQTAAKVFDVSIHIVAIGGTLIIAELVIFLLIFSWVKRWVKNIGVLAILYIFFYLFILMIDGLLFPLFAFAADSELVNIIYGNITGKIVMGSLYCIPMLAFILLNRQRFVAFVEKPMYLSDLLKSSRQALQVALQDSERRYRLLVDSSPYAIAIYQQEKLVFVNPASIRLIGGKDENDLIGMPISDIIHPETFEAARDRIGRMLKGESGLYPTEDRYIRLDGSVVPVEVTAAPFTYEGRPAIQVIALDITERKRDEDKLKESEEKYRTLIEHASDGIFVANPQGYYVEVNTSGCLMLGYTRNELLGKHLVDLVASDNLTVQPLRLDELKAGKSLISKRILKRKDGTLIPVEISARMLPDGHLLGMLRDITERKQAEEAIYRFNQRLTFLHEIDKDIIAARSPEALTQAVLKSIYQLIPCHRATVTLIDEAASESVVFATHSEDLAAFPITSRTPLIYNERLELLQSGRVMVIPDLQKLDGPISEQVKEAVSEGIRSGLGVPLLVQGQLLGHLSLGSKTPAYFTSEHQEIAQEIANQLAIALHQARLHQQIKAYTLELEQRVAERTLQLEAKNRELETFTYSVSHDLKAPLRGIDGYSRLLLEDYLDRLDEDGRSFLHNIRVAADQMSQLIDDLLAYSRLERRNLQTDKISPQKLVDALLTERAGDLEKRHVTVTLTIPDTMVTADREGLAMALRNLLDNALKFTQETEVPSIEIGGHETETFCILWVRDNGIGFDMKYHDRILEMFQRLHRAEEYPGTGIGLAIVHKAMQRMGGRVWAESEQGKGSTFYLEVPK